MGRRSLMKRTKKQFLLPTIKSLPEELLIEVIARVGTSSVNGLFNVKQSCKYFYKVGGDGEVFRRVSLEKLPAVSWLDSSDYHSFIKQCEEKGNPEALFKRGMVEYFSMKQESGMESLKKAACLGHKEAAYMLGLILLCTTNHQAEALEVLKMVEQQGSSPSTNIQKCRKRLKDIIGQMWTSRGSLPQPPEPICTSIACKRNRLKSSGWLSIDEDEEPNSNCGACRWDREIVLLRNVLHAA